MAELTNTQKKEIAQILYLKEQLKQKEIAEKVGISEQTICKWAKTGKWEELKIGITMTREQQIGNLHRQVAEINNAILTRPEGERYANSKEADSLNKLASTIKKMESELGISDIISVGMRFIDWLRATDLVRAKEVTLLYDAFIKDQL